MASIGYSAPPDTQVSFVLPDGRSKVVKFSDKGTYSTSNADEIAALDALGELESHPIAFAPKKG
jgi:hypothetical protein